MKHCVALEVHPSVVKAMSFASSSLAITSSSSLGNTLRLKCSQLGTSYLGSSTQSKCLNPLFSIAGKGPHIQCHENSDCLVIAWALSELACGLILKTLTRVTCCWGFFCAPPRSIAGRCLMLLYLKSCLQHEEALWNIYDKLCVWCLWYNCRLYTLLDNWKLPKLMTWTCLAPFIISP